jgi:hypothetical protein
MRKAAAAILISAGALIVAGVVGSAGAETTPAATAAVRAVSVQGFASEPIGPAASGAEATAVYRQAMAAAVSDGQSKAQFLAEKSGAGLGPVQSIGEGGGYIQCPEGEEYSGSQPDWGGYGYGVAFAGASTGASSPPVPMGRPVPSPPAKPFPKPKHRKKHRPAAKKAAAEASCTLHTQVSLAYQLT